MTRQGWKTIAVLAVVALGVLAVAQLFRSRRPYTVQRAALSGWQLVAGRGAGGVAIGLRPPAALTDALYEQVTSRHGSLSAPEQPIVPLVLRDEFDTSLMGVLSAEDLMEIARESGVESAAFEPVCMAEHAAESDAGPERLYFVLFESTGFEKARADLMPTHPEHGGAVEFDPRALSPILAVAATDDRFSRWWPLLPRDQTDCRIAMRTE